MVEGRKVAGLCCDVAASSAQAGVRQAILLR